MGIAVGLHRDAHMQIFENTMIKTVRVVLTGDKLCLSKSTSTCDLQSELVISWSGLKKKNDAYVFKEAKYKHRR